MLHFSKCTRNHLHLALGKRGKKQEESTFSLRICHIHCKWKPCVLRQLPIVFFLLQFNQPWALLQTKFNLQLSPMPSFNSLSSVFFIPNFFPFAEKTRCATSTPALGLYLLKPHGLSSQQMPWLFNFERFFTDFVFVNWNVYYYTIGSQNKINTTYYVIDSFNFLIKMIRNAAVTLLLQI